MTSHRESRLVPYTADVMFDVVADVEKYPQFLPWVTDLKVLSRVDVNGRDVMMAEMTVGFSAFKEHYISRVVVDRENRAVDVVQTEGPFRILENHWLFAPEGDGCRIDFSIEFEFRSRLLNAVAGRAFERVAQKMAEAFEVRARKLSKKSSKQV